MTDTFSLRLVSPAQIVFEGDVTFVEIPGSEGDFGVLAHHVPLLSMLREGTITAHTDAKTTQSFHVSAGYADISDEGCTIIAEHIQAA